MKNRTFNIAASEVVATETGAGFRSCTLQITLDASGAIASVVPMREGYIEGAPNPEPRC